MTDVMTRLTGALAHRYRLERELGQGGMATVYLAHDFKRERRSHSVVTGETRLATLSHA